MRYDTVVIGGGQAGLAMGWHLARSGRDFVILDAAARVGDAWRSRWDSLTLFTPARYDALPGMPFPAEPDHWPGKDEVADYLERYAYVFGLPVRSGEAVRSVRRSPDGRGFLIESALACYQADQVVVATGPFQRALLPPVAAHLGSGVAQLHSGAYRNPSQLPDGPVLVVGAGNSGVQIASELAATRPAWLAVGEALPSLPLTLGGASIFRWLEGLGAMDVSVDSWMGEKASRREFLIGSSLRELARNGARLTGRVIGASEGRLRVAGADSIEPAAVVWATGYRPDYGFVELPVIGARGEPLHRRGVTSERGLYFLGLPWQHTRGSALLGWVGRDAEHIASRLAPPTRAAA